MIRLIQKNDLGQHYPPFTKQPNLQILEDALKRLHAIFDTVIDGIITIDKDGIMESVNPAAANLFGYKQQELLGSNISMLMTSEHRSKHDGYLDRYQKTGEARIIGIGREVPAKHKDGREIPIRLAVSEVKLNNGQIIYTGIIHDLTEIKEAERTLIRLNQDLEARVTQRTLKLQEVISELLDVNSRYEKELAHRKEIEETLLQNEIKLINMLEKEKELSELKSRFVSMASHEFKTPLSTILSSASLIRRYALDEHIDKREKHIDRINRSVKHLDAILNDFLSLSKLEEGRIDLTISRFPISAICNELIADMQSILKAGQHIEFQDMTNGKEIQTDKRILTNILINLVSNASKYSEEGKSIWCSASFEQDQLVLAVRDEGIGIPKSDQKHLFSRFFRASNAINIKGTGLGLHIILGYLKLIDGKIEFESELNKGSIFKIRLQQ